MPRFQHTNLPLPRIWLMSDERLDDAFFDIVRRLPRGAGIIFRHYSLPQQERRTLFRYTLRIARRRGLVLFLSGSEVDAINWKADGWHNRTKRRGAARNLPSSAPAHDTAELSNANRVGVDAVLLSPLFSTKSHKGAKPLGLNRFGVLASLSQMPVIALGGMTRQRAAMLGKRQIYGWAAISAFQISR